MCLGAAPTDRRSPISARRWMTESSVVLAIARTPTPSAISAIASSSEVSEELTDCLSWVGSMGTSAAIRFGCNGSIAYGPCRPTSCAAPDVVLTMIWRPGYEPNVPATAVTVPGGIITPSSAWGSSGECSTMPITVSAVPLM